jgi:hypothetical protein
MTLATRQPTGRPSWPILLLTGVEKAGKTYLAAQASASDLIDRTLWVGFGEDDPDEYGAIEGARFEIVPHAGTYRSALQKLVEAAAEPAPNGKPHLLVFDSGTRLWDLRCGTALTEPNDRALAKARKYGKAAPDPDADVTVTSDLWNLAKQRWSHVIDVLREHQGPSIITARLDVVTLFDAEGNPTKDKTSRVKAEKSLPYEVGAIVELPALGEAWVRGVRSLRFKPGDTGKVAFPDFTVDALWRRLGLADETPGERTHSGANERPRTPHAPLVNEIALLADRAGIPRAQVATEWAESHDGQPINEATDLGALELLRDDLTARVEAAESTTGQETGTDE